jgi:hypothetical protein
MPMGLVVNLVVRLAFSIAHGQARNSYRLASSRIPVVLDLENSLREVGASSSSETNSRFDSNDQSREPDLGRTSDPQRTHEVGH